MAVIHHSDQGGQYTSLDFGQRCDEAGVRPSMGSLGDCFDNAMCESFFATLECELLEPGSPAEAGAGPDRQSDRDLIFGLQWSRNPPYSKSKRKFRLNGA